MATSVLPPVYYYFFWLVEPFLTLLGAGYAIFLPEKYAKDLIPQGVEILSELVVGRSVRGKMLVGGLGSCFFLLAMISLSLFPVFKNALRSQPAVQEKAVKGLLIPLAIADISHIILTLLPLPPHLLSNPLKWNSLIWGNVGITFGLFVMRVLWLFGVGRASGKNLARAAKIKTK